MRRAIEDYFPIVDINRLAVPERNAFKPIYQMHKWFARRASCVFRAILLGCLKPAGTDIMAEFYKDHTHDPDTNGKGILDPFMGGGTTVVEALRLGCKVIGIDLNPVAWFIVKTEIEPVDLDVLRDAFERLANRPVTWSGKSVRETLLEQYKTACPCCGTEGQEADIIYTFWVKSAICTNPRCKHEVPLYSDYITAQKKPSIRYWRDASCPQCHKTFDWEIEPATLIAEPRLMRHDGRTSAGDLRGNVRWAYGTGETVCCPWCDQQVNPLPAPSRMPGRKPKPERKKVPLTVLLCPHCESVWQWRGELPEEVTCPTCTKAYDPHYGNVPERGKFVCSLCGTKDAIINSIRSLPDDQLLPMQPYAMQGYCANCAGDSGVEDDEESDLFDENKPKRKPNTKFVPNHSCMLIKNGGKFFKRISPADWARYQAACQAWEREEERLPYPRQEIPLGEKTKSGLLAHHYHYWHQMFNLRQLLCLATLLKGIEEEQNNSLKELLLVAFSNTLEANNVFTRFIAKRSTPGGTPPAGIFARHDYQPKLTLCEQNVWGVKSGNNTFRNRQQAVMEAVGFAHAPWDSKWKPETNWVTPVITNERFYHPEQVSLRCQDARFVGDLSVHFVITDPPYAGNVNYSELSDFFYVWLRLVLAKSYREFMPEIAPKADEIIENPTRGKSAQDFEDGLTQALSECQRLLADDGLLTFTFHHAEGNAWEALLRAICNAGFEIHSVYPIHSEREASLHLLDKEAAISYDLIHVCKKRDPNVMVEPRSWAGIRQEIRRRARQEIRAIEAGRYGNEPLSPADVNIILIGKCLELYSRHYGAVIDHVGHSVALHEALKEIRSMVDDLVSNEHPLPAELEDIDAESRLYLLTLCDRKEVKSDDVHKATRGVLEPDEIIAAGLMIKGRAKRGRTYEVKQPAERYHDLLEKFQHSGRTLQTSLFDDTLQSPTNHKVTFIDHVHFLMGLVEAGENVLPWLDRFRGLTPQIRAACEYLRQRNPAFAPMIQKILGLMDPGPLFRV